MKPLHVSLSGPHLQRLLTRVLDSHLFTSGSPEFVSVDDEAKPPSADWVDRWVPRCRRNVFAAWDGSFERFVDYSKDSVVKASAPSVDYAPATILSWLETLPFTVASFGSIHPAWSDRRDFPGPGFADMHFPLGWACAFRGEGHARLVSRRWPDYGPWRLTRGGDDVSFVEFHDFDADPDTAFAQARPGHDRMGISPTGGFIQSDYVYTYPLDGLYTPEEQRLTIPVHGREVSQLEMLDACAARLYQALGAERPLRTIAYVFAAEGQARTHLHELWLRELGCRAIIAGREVELDTEHRHTPMKPVWASKPDAE